jgi:hypothetical protein
MHWLENIKSAVKMTIYKRIKMNVYKRIKRIPLQKKLSNWSKEKCIMLYLFLNMNIRIPQ